MTAVLSFVICVAIILIVAYYNIHRTMKLHAELHSMQRPCPACLLLELVQIPVVRFGLHCNTFVTFQHLLQERLPVIWEVLVQPPSLCRGTGPHNTPIWLRCSSRTTEHQKVHCVTRLHVTLPSPPTLNIKNIIESFHNPDCTLYHSHDYSIRTVQPHNI